MSDNVSDPTEIRGSETRTNAWIALAEGLLGGLVLGAVVGGFGYLLLPPGQEGWALFIGGIFGGLLGPIFGLAGALAVIAAGLLSPKDSRRASMNRDRLWGTITLLVGGVALALGHLNGIDLEEGRRLPEVLLLALAPAITGLAWSYTVGLPHLKTTPPAPPLYTPPAPGMPQ